MNQDFQDKHILITGGAGFIGTNLTMRLIQAGAKITVVDNFITGFKKNIDASVTDQNIRLIEADVSEEYTSYLPPDAHFDIIFHLASIASPVGYTKYPLETAHINGPGTEHMAKLAKEHDAVLIYTSTSESYGDPLVHPQSEEYWGNVNPIGPRACYDVSKRYGEMIIKNYINIHDINARTVRIFNTYGPYMDLDDGRVIPNFIKQVKSRQPLSVYGDGGQTRSFCYVDDLVEYLVRVASIDKARGEVINIGNPEEKTIRELADTIVAITKYDQGIELHEARKEDPARRRPDISKAQAILGYTPSITLREGLEKTLHFYNVATR